VYTVQRAGAKQRGVCFVVFVCLVGYVCFDIVPLVCRLTKKLGLTAFRAGFIKHLPPDLLTLNPTNQPNPTRSKATDHSTPKRFAP